MSLIYKFAEAILVYCNFVNNNYPKGPRFMYTCVLNKSFDQLLEISPTNFIFLKIFNSEFPYIKVWFTNQNSKPVEIKDKINITL